MPLEDWIHHWNAAQFFYDWQTLIAGFLALAAAIGTILATRSTANEQIKAAREQADRQIAAAHAQIDANARLERLRAQNERDDESVAAAIEMEEAIYRCRSAIEN
jgi:hypothetical protein